MPGDLDGDLDVDGADIQAFIVCAIAGDTEGECLCADVAAPTGSMTQADIDTFVTMLLGE